MRSITGGAGLVAPRRPFLPPVPHSFFPVLAPAPHPIPGGDECAVSVRLLVIHRALKICRMEIRRDRGIDPDRRNIVARISDLEANFEIGGRARGFALFGVVGVEELPLVTAKSDLAKGGIAGGDDGISSLEVGPGAGLNAFHGNLSLGTEPLRLERRTMSIYMVTECLCVGSDSVRWAFSHVGVFLFSRGAIFFSARAAALTMTRAYGLRIARDDRGSWFGGSSRVFAPGDETLHRDHLPPEGGGARGQQAERYP
jgi:hypothetical protein